jgi:hypothetical protein
MVKKSETICVDFDKTLCLDDKFGKPNTKIVNVLKHFWEKGFYIVLYSSRKKKDRVAILAWLLYNCPYIDDVVLGKPEAVVYIDDRAVHRDRLFMTSHIEMESRRLKVIE